MPELHHGLNAFPLTTPSLLFIAELYDLAAAFLKTILEPTHLAQELDPLLHQAFGKLFLFGVGHFQKNKFLFHLILRLPELLQADRGLEVLIC